MCVIWLHGQFKRYVVYLVNKNQLGAQFILSMFILTVVSLGIFSMVPLTEPCALGSTQPLKVSTRDFSWGKGGRCIWLTTYHPCSAETSRSLTLPGTLWATSACRGTPLLYYYVYYEHIYQSLHVSDNYGPIIRRNNCVTAWYAGWNETHPPCIPDSHPHRITSIKRLINTVVSPDDGHIIARNM